MPASVNKHNPRVVSRESLKKRLYRFILVQDGCWPWMGPIDSISGYGRIKIRGVMKGAHRVVYTTLVGAIPDGLTLDHLCRNLICVNPAHLEPVTQAENNRRSIRTKLTYQDVKYIRKSPIRSLDIAELFGVNPSTVSKVRLNKRWRIDKCHV